MRRRWRGALAAFAPRRVLETAAGTGAVTEALHEPCRTPKSSRPTSTSRCSTSRPSGSARTDVRFVQADAQDLPFEDGGFDLVVCQFGAMFFPDKVRGHSEARRVLGDGGHYLLAIWDRIERNS